MSWFITSVNQTVDNQNREILVIEGFNSTVKDQCLKSIITKTNLIDALTYEHDFNEHYSISIVNPNEVYTIIIDFINNRNIYYDLKDTPSVSINKSQYFNGPIHMGLPMIVFGQWQGSVLVK